ncbi:hypothetical protein J2S49_000705 [Arcanobacterium wilhelmae]|uniref:DUF2207 domain-containing protein n=1 Tax=Arcanobacterium wilhelmae TaxID=1803177 RepID=A0ABT9NA94_9ACTO|nr:hypothetical protein [Arcanobacterium wilhelmae]MDP9800629.1 hypothetical protein [Arcanobacterium wilhelmae]WFN90036.1 hypothetical protein P8A24_07530 [Arcanobacterium wilhelmae]
MKIGVMLWGALLVISGVFAILVGTGVNVSGFALVVGLLLILASIFVVAAFIPAMMNDGDEHSTELPTPLAS